MRRRQIALVMAAAMAASALSGCGGSGNSGSATTAAPATTAAAASEAPEAGGESAGETEGADGEAASGDKEGYLSTFDVAGAGDVSLDVMITSLGDSDGGPFLRGVMDKYMEMYPNVTLTPVECSMNDLYTTLITQATAGTLPDIFTMSEAYSANCLEMGMMVDNLPELLGEDYMNGLVEQYEGEIECLKKVH